MNNASSPPSLLRTVGLPGAILLGLGSILGTGVFVSVGLAAAHAGDQLVPALGCAALLAVANGLASANLAAAHPVAGGTYEYGYKFLGPPWGFTAGWMFLAAKSASMATAALGFAHYLRLALFPDAPPEAAKALAAASVLVVTLVTAGGMKRSSRVNAAMVALTVLGLGSFIALALSASTAPLAAAAPAPVSTESFLHAVAILFVAYTGYGRIATLGEEVREPARTIPRAVIATLAVAALLYMGVAAAAIHAVSAQGFADLAHGQVATLAALAKSVAPGAGVLAAALPLVTIASVTAMLGVQLNLSLGLSRVVLAMARRRDLPTRLGALAGDPPSPRAAVAVVGVVVAALVVVFDVRLSWSFSAFNVLLYYALTNLAALRLPKAQRRYPLALPLVGLATCAFLAFFVDKDAVVFSVALWAVGFAAWLWSQRTRVGERP